MLVTSGQQGRVSYGKATDAASILITLSQLRWRRPHLCPRQKAFSEMPEPFIGAKCGGTKAWQLLGDSCKSHQDREDCRIRVSGCSVEVETRRWGVEAGSSPVEVLTAQGRGEGRRAGGKGEGKGEGGGEEEGGGHDPSHPQPQPRPFPSPSPAPPSSTSSSLPPPSPKAVTQSSTSTTFRSYPPPPFRSTSTSRYHQSIRILSHPLYSLLPYFITECRYPLHPN